MDGAEPHAAKLQLKGANPGLEQTQAQADPAPRAPRSPNTPRYFPTGIRVCPRVPKPFGHVLHSSISISFSVPFAKRCLTTQLAISKLSGDCLLF